MAEFQDKVIVVTGASEGIGRALCLALAPQKPKLVLAARTEERLDELKNEIEPHGGQALVAPTDITSEEACKGLIQTAVSAWGGIDVLVNNAGRTMWTTLEDLKNTTIIEQLIRVNYLGAAYCTYYALPYLKASKGRIATISSVTGLNGVPTRTAYSASKHALFGFFDSLRIELIDTGVTVTMIAPDFVLSQMHRRAFDSDGDQLGTNPLQEDKIMTAEDCAAMIVKAIENRDRLLITSLRGQLARWMKIIAPGAIDNLALKAIRERK